MAGWYYLVPQLPSFQVQGASPLPITGEYLRELCSRSFGAREMKTLCALSLEPPREYVKTGSAVVDAWYAGERDLRIALAQLRAAKLKKEYPVSYVPSDIMQIARTAVNMDPLSAEQYLNDTRAALLDAITPMDNFCTDAVYVYALKLMLAERIRLFNKEAGLASYHRIYDLILGESK